MKKLFFLALMAFLWLPATTWANDVNEEFDDNEEETYDENGNGTITSSSISLDYKILTVATGNTQETAGTVELEGVATSSASATIGALSIPHLIVHVELDESYNTYTYYYTVVGIAANAFRDNSTISSVTIPYTVTYIGNFAFDDCDNLTMLSFAETGTTPSELEKIETGAFRGAPIGSLDLPASVESLGEKAFQACAQITSLELPASLATISQNAFENCGKLATVTLSGNTTLGEKAFGDCGKMTAVVFNDENPTSISGGASSEADPFGGDESDDIILYVPTGYAAVYASSDWNTLVSTDTELSWNFFSTNVSANGFNSEENTYYATYYVDEEGYILDGATAYYVSGVTDGEINTQDITGIIPEGTAILIGSSAADDYYFYKEYESTKSVEEISNNMLYGTNDEDGILTVGPNGETEGYYFYKLSRNADGEAGSAGFYWGADDGGQFLSAAYKAYLAVPQEDAEGLSHISFKKDEGDTTGISAVESASEKAVSGIYTIQGVRVNNMNQPGLYIVDGKKVLVK